MLLVQNSGFPCVSSSGEDTWRQLEEFAWFRQEDTLIHLGSVPGDSKRAEHNDESVHTSLVSSQRVVIGFELGAVGDDELSY